MIEKWDGNLVMSTHGGPIIDISLGHFLAQKDAEINKLRKENDDLRAKIELQNQTIDKLVKEIEENDSSPCIGHLR